MLPVDVNPSDRREQAIRPEAAATLASRQAQMPPLAGVPELMILGDVVALMIRCCLLEAEGVLALMTRRRLGPGDLPPPKVP